MNTFELIYDVVRRIPRGCVASYGQVAMLAGNRRWARVVGYAMHAVAGRHGVPCHRVVTAVGGLSSAFALGGENAQRLLLEGEGVGFLPDGRVDMARFQWDGH